MAKTVCERETKRKENLMNLEIKMGVPIQDLRNILNDSPLRKRKQKK